VFGVVFRALSDPCVTSDRFKNFKKLFKIATVRKHGKVGLSFPETRCMDVYAALNWILTEKDELMPFILQCREDRNEIGEVHRGTQVSEELHAWVEPL
jgi:hypothetical protein